MSLVTIERSATSRIATLILNRPGANALNTALLQNIVTYILFIFRLICNYILIFVLFS